MPTICRNTVGFLLYMILGTRSEDPCKRLHSSSFCLTSGMCSPPLQISCTEAYVQLSADLLVPFASPPLSIQVSSDQMSFTRAIAESRQCLVRPVLPDYISENRHYMELLILMGRLSADLTNHFPFVTASPTLLQQLVLSAEHVAREIITPLVADGNNPAMTLIACAFYGDQAVLSVSYIARIGARYLASADRSVRSALMGNWIQIIHACSRVYQLLKLPDLFARPAFLEFFTEAVKFDPLYEDDYAHKQWIISMVQYQQDLVLPLVPPADLDDFPLEVIERLAIDNSRPPAERIDRILQRLAASIDNSSVKSTINIVRSTLFYMLNFPGIRALDRLYFCTQSQSLWTRLLSTLTQSQTDVYSDNFIPLIDLFRICGKSYLSIDDRVRLVLPIVLTGSRTRRSQVVSLTDTHGKTTFETMFLSMWRIRIPLLRSPIILQVGNSQPINDTGNGRILSGFLRTLLRENLQRALRVHDTKASTHMRENALTHIPMMVLGRVIALLVLAGDPEHLLESLLVNRSIPNLYMNMFHVRNGFCQVLDCNMFDTLFSDEELPVVVHILRQHKHILNR